MRDLAPCLPRAGAARSSSRLRMDPAWGQTIPGRRSLPGQAAGPDQVDSYPGRARRRLRHHLFRQHGHRHGAPHRHAPDRGRGAGRGPRAHRHDRGRHRAHAESGRHRGGSYGVARGGVAAPSGGDDGAAGPARRGGAAARAPRGRSGGRGRRGPRARGRRLRHLCRADRRQAVQSQARPRGAAQDARPLPADRQVPAPARSCPRRSPAPTAISTTSRCPACSTPAWCGRRPWARPHRGGRVVDRLHPRRARGAPAELRRRARRERVGRGAGARGCSRPRGAPAAACPPTPPSSTRCGRARSSATRRSPSAATCPR